MSSCIPSWIFAIFVCCSTALMRGDDKAAEVASEAADPLVKRIEKAVTQYEVRWMADEKPMTPKTASRWRNVERGQEAVALLVFWTRGGRPAAQASIYPWQGNLIHEFTSLSSADAVGAFDDGTQIWLSRKDGVTFRDFIDAPEPADTPNARLRQMKLLAEKFEAVLTGWRADNSDRETLRLLSKELYRYDEEALRQAGSSVRDGAVFGFVQGTDPEVTLLVQAETVGGKLSWRYACARATSGGLEVKLDDKIVWTVERNYQLINPSGETFVMRSPLEAPADEFIAR
jgi:hypothetical protein